MIRQRPSRLLKFSVWLLISLLSGCGLSNERPTVTPPPTETLPALAPGTTAIVDICQANPQHPDCVGLQKPTPPTQEWETFTDPLGRFAFLYPSGWYTMTVTPDPSDGVRVMDAPHLQESTRWVSVHVFQNPQRASIPIWVAEHGVGWPGKITWQEEGYVNNVPVLRQRLENDDPNLGGPYIYALLWYPLEEWILRWTAWPGQQAETNKLLEQMVSSLRKP